MLFLIKFSCPDLSNAVSKLAKVNNGATQENFKQMLRAVKIVLDTRRKILRFKPAENEKDNVLWDVYSYSDSNYANNKDTRVNVSWFCVFVLGPLFSWKSRGQRM